MSERAVKVISMDEALQGPYEISQSYSLRGWDDNGWVPVYRNVPDSDRLVLGQLAEQGTARPFFALVQYRQGEWMWEGKNCTDLMFEWKDLDSRCDVIKGYALECGRDL